MSPLRRVRRVQRWLFLCGAMAPSCQWVHSRSESERRQMRWPESYDQRCGAADGLFAVELEFCTNLAAMAIKGLTEDAGLLGSQINECANGVHKQAGEFGIDLRSPCREAVKL